MNCKYVPYFGLFLLCISIPAKADLYGFVDGNGRAHVSNTKLDSRYTLFKKESSKTNFDNGLASLQRSVLPSSKIAILYRAAHKQYDPLIIKIAKQWNIEPSLLHAVISVESGYDANAISPKGAVGLMQILPATANRFGITNLFDPAQNLHAGARYLAYLLRFFDNNLELVLAAYNAGENSVLRHGNAIPPFKETQQYVPKVLEFYRAYKLS